MWNVPQTDLVTITFVIIELFVAAVVKVPSQLSCQMVHLQPFACITLLRKHNDQWKVTELCMGNFHRGGGRRPQAWSGPSPARTRLGQL